MVQHHSTIICIQVLCDFEEMKLHAFEFFNKRFFVMIKSSLMLHINKNQ